MFLCSYLFNIEECSRELREMHEKEQLVRAIHDHNQIHQSLLNDNGTVTLQECLTIYNLAKPSDLILQLKYANICSDHGRIDCSEDHGPIEHNPGITNTSLRTLVLGYFYALVCWDRTDDFFVYLLNATKPERVFMVLLATAFYKATYLVDLPNLMFDEGDIFFMKYFFSAAFFQSPTFENILPMETRKTIIKQCHLSILAKKNDRHLPLFLSRDIIMLGLNQKEEEPEEVIDLRPYSPTDPDEDNSVLLLSSMRPGHKKCIGPCSRSFTPY